MSILLIRFHNELNGWSCNIVLLMFICMFTVFLIPFSLLIFNLVLPVSQIFFFMVTSNNDSNIVSIYPANVDYIYQNNDFQSIYSFKQDQIKLNPKFIIDKNNLIFCETLNVCSEQKASLNIVLNSNINNLRSSSPKEYKFKNLFYLKQEIDLNKIFDMANTSKLLYVSHKMPTRQILNKILSCSNTSKIYIHNSINNSYQCNIKYLKNEKLYETSCININDKTYNIEINCNSVNSEFQLISSNKILEKSNLTFSKGFTHSLCCLNNSHSISLYGNCKNINTFELVSNLNNLEFISSSECIEYRFLKYFAFKVISKNCAVQISYYTSCYNNQVYDNNCGVDLFDCKDIFK